VNELLDQLREQFSDGDEEARYVYADSFVNAHTAAQIKALREQRDMSQQELAEKIGTKQSGISRLENINYDSWKIDTLRRIAKAYGLWLDIEFREFSELPGRIRGFNRESLRKRGFSEDPAFHVSPVGSSFVSPGYYSAISHYMDETRQMAESAGIAAIPSGSTVSPIAGGGWMEGMPYRQCADLETGETSPAGKDHLWTDVALEELKEIYRNAYALLTLPPEPEKAVAELPKGLVVMPPKQSIEIRQNPVSQPMARAA